MANIQAAIDALNDNSDVLTYPQRRALNRVFRAYHEGANLFPTSVPGVFVEAPEPVFEPDVKVGDWVVSFDNPNHPGHGTRILGRVESIRDGCPSQGQSMATVRLPGRVWTSDFNLSRGAYIGFFVRKATPAEIFKKGAKVRYRNGNVDLKVVVRHDFQTCNNSEVFCQYGLRRIGTPHYDFFDIDKCTLLEPAPNA